MALNFEKIFSWKFLSHELIYESSFSFLCEAMMLYRYVLQNLLSYNYNAYLLITAWKIVHDTYVANYILLQLVGV